MAAWGYEFYLLMVSRTRSLRALVRDTAGTRRETSYPRAPANVLHLCNNVYRADCLWSLTMDSAILVHMI